MTTSAPEETEQAPVAEPGTSVADLNRTAALEIRGQQEWWTGRQRAALASIGLEGTPDGDLMAFLHLCQATALDPFRREIYLIGRKQGSGRDAKVKWTAQTGIDGFRFIAERTGEYLGRTDPEWCGPDGAWRDVWLDPETPPAAARVRVKRRSLDGGEPIVTTGTVMYAEFVPMKDEWKDNQKTGKRVPQGQWGVMPAHMLAKCLPGRTLIQTDRGSLMLRDIVNDRLPVKVRSVDLVTGEECWQSVVNYWRNAPTRDWVRVWTPNGGRGNRALRLTPDHPMWTPLGWKDAGDLAPGDMVAVTSPTLSAEQVQVIQGGLLGDGSLAGRKRDSTLPHYAESHSVKQEGYLRWKAAALANLGTQVETCMQSDGAGGSHLTVRMRTRSVAALYAFRQQKPVERLEGLDALGLAVWFMDDGQFRRGGDANLHCCGFGDEFADAAVAWFRDRHGIDAKVLRRGRNPYLTFGVAATPHLMAIIAPWVERDGTSKGTSKQWVGGPVTHGKEAGIAFVPVLRTESVTTKDAEARYDIEVAKTHTFVVNNVVISNCAEAFAIRSAFPRQVANVYLHEEMQKADEAEKTIVAEQQAEARRTAREQAREQGASRPWNARTGVLLTPPADGEPEGATETAEAVVEPSEPDAEPPTEDEGIVEAEVVPDMPSVDRDALFAELDEQAKTLNVARAALTRRWAAQHRKNVDDATDEELLALVLGFREMVAHKAGGGA